MAEQLRYEFVDGTAELVRRGSRRYWELTEDGHTPVGVLPESDGISDAMETYLAARFGVSDAGALAAVEGEVSDVQAELAGRLSEAALSATIAAEVDPVALDAATAYTMAVKGFTPKTQPVNEMWAFPGVAGHGFVSAGSVGATFDLNDTADPALGDRSVKIVTPGTGAAASTYAAVSKTGLVIDATAQFVRVWIKMDDPARVAQLNLLLGDNTFTNYFQAQFYTPESMESRSNFKAGEWLPFDIPWSYFTATGTPSRASLTAARLLVYDRGSAYGPATINWNGAAGVTESTTYPNGVISLTFDDTFASTYTIARPYMDKYGYAGTLYPIQNNFDLPGKLTLDQAHALMSVNGWDFGYHASTQVAHDTGFDALTEAQLVAEFEAQRAWARANNVRGDSFAWPLTQFSALSERVAADFFQTGRGGVDRTLETLPPSQPYRLRCIKAHADATVASLSAQVDKVKAGKGWGVVMFHDIVASGHTGNDTTTAIFQGFIDYINAEGVAVATVSQVMNNL